jgi:hypothetical protein
MTQDQRDRYAEVLERMASKAPQRSSTAAHIRKAVQLARAPAEGSFYEGMQT